MLPYRAKLEVGAGFRELGEQTLVWSACSAAPLPEHHSLSLGLQAGHTKQACTDIQARPENI